MIQHIDRSLEPLHRLGRICSRRAATLAVMLTLLSPLGMHSTAAADGIGSAWVTNVTNSTMTLDWTNPNGTDYRRCGGMEYKIEVKTGTIWNGVTTFEIVTTSKPCLLQNMLAATEYRCTVFVKAEKKNALGNWKNCQFRKVSKITQTTNADPPTTNNIVSITAASAGSIDVTATVPNASQFEIIRFGYKKVFSQYELDQTIKGRLLPMGQWVTSDEKRGWIDVPAQSSTNVSFDGLKDCKTYKVVVYGFPTGVNTGTKLGEAKGHTGAACKTFDMAELVLDDHPVEQSAYVARLAAFYGERCTSIFGHVSSQYPQILSDFAAPADGDTLESAFDTAAYLVGEQPSVYGSWQNEADLRAAGLDLPHFLQQNYPALYAALIDETYEGTTGVGPIDVGGPPAFRLVQNSPNPFNPTTAITFELARPGPLTLEIFDVAGRSVRTLIREPLHPEGARSVTWNGLDDAGRSVAGGLYFCQLTANGRADVLKMVLLK